MKDPYPGLEPDDPMKDHTDAEILRSKISLRGSALTSKERSHLMTMILKYKKAFSLQYETGNCLSNKTDIKVIDELPFLSDHSRLVKKTNLSWTDTWRI